jgi:hypothetical protein
MKYLPRYPRRRHPRPARRNPIDATEYWLIYGMLIAAAFGVWGWKHMTDAQKREMFG